MRHKSHHRSYNFQAGLLMTVLIGAAFVIHHHEEAQYLASGSESYSLQENERSTAGASKSFARNKNIPVPRETAASFNAPQ